MNQAQHEFEKVKQSDYLVVRQGYPNLKEAVRILEDNPARLVIFVFFLHVGDTDKSKKKAIDYSVKATGVRPQLNQIPSAWRSTVMNRVMTCCYPIDKAVSQEEMKETLSSIHSSYSRHLDNPNSPANQ